MRALLILLTIQLLGCSNNFKSTTRLHHNIWVNYDLQFDTSFATGDKSIYAIYGSGTLLFFDTNHTVKAFTNTFIKHNDSLGWGEPGVILTNGSWKWKDENIIATNRLIEKTFLLPTDTIGSVTIDSYMQKGDTLIRNNKEKFIPTKLLTTELHNYLNSNWNILYEKNSR